MNSSIGYRGGVRARLSVHNSNGRHFKNKGYKPLWNLLAKAITGNNFSTMCPASIGIYQKDGDVYRSLTYSPIPIYGKVWGDVVEESATSTSALFTATATYADRKNDATGDVVLRLLTASDEVLAEVDDIDGILRDIHNAMIPGIDAIYEWQLTFENMEVHNG